MDGARRIGCQLAWQRVRQDAEIRALSGSPRIKRLYHRDGDGPEGWECAWQARWQAKGYGPPASADACREAFGRHATARGCEANARRLLLDRLP